VPLVDLGQGEFDNWGLALLLITLITIWALLKVESEAAPLFVALQVDMRRVELDRVDGAVVVRAQVLPLHLHQEVSVQ